MAKFSCLRIEREVLWIFRQKAKMKYCKNEAEEILKQFPKDSYYIQQFFGPMGSKKLFNKSIKLRDGQPEQIGKMLLAGERVNTISLELTADPALIYKLRKIILEYRGVDCKELLKKNRVASYFSRSSGVNRDGRFVHSTGRTYNKRGGDCRE